ncbi:hypothetical protein R5W24_006327 [Gemmata sp. JC717]|uniref:hypothetical protein n=1 Tax=Gemmata algarum TaxID=2975278 RepID=UPI0021BB0DAC|nr:hypothetical protein [Gemmata algarum]MDY3557140.1 hypothetical protein [Gemmata algarum]
MLRMYVAAYCGTAVPVSPCRIAACFRYPSASPAVEVVAVVLVPYVYAVTSPTVSLRYAAFPPLNPTRSAFPSLYPVTVVGPASSTTRPSASYRV